LQALTLLPHTGRRRDDSLELLHWLNRHIDALDLQVATAVAADPNARRLMTHPGVGPLTALATVLVLGPVARFPGSKHVVSYIGLAPAVHASADKYRLGHISKQGSALLRWVLGQAAPLATRGDADLKRVYFAVLRRRGRPTAKVALARRLLIRLYVMLRDEVDYNEFCRRGRTGCRGLEPAGSPVGTRTTLQTWRSSTWYRSSIPSSLRASSPSDFARRSRRFTSMLDESTTTFVIPREVKYRCSQNPSRPAS
jgi:Transposase IS116/IS110/IS902 family